MPKSCGQCHSLNTIRTTGLNRTHPVRRLYHEDSDIFAKNKQIILKYLESGWPHGYLRKNSRKLGKNHKLSPDFEVLFVFLLSGWLPKISFSDSRIHKIGGEMKEKCSSWNSWWFHEIHLAYIFEKIFHRIGHSIF